VPLKVWEDGPDGRFSEVKTRWEWRFTPEERRAEAEALDRVLDSVLDLTLERVAHAKTDFPEASESFLRAWLLGRGLDESNILGAPAVQDEPREWLWLALARKCRLGARSDGSLELQWSTLRPSNAREPERRPDGSSLDYFEMCRWLAEQELADAVGTFAGSVNNAWQMLERPALANIKLRQAFLSWLRSQTVRDQARLGGRTVYRDMMKALRRRWPARGLGSARRPEHYGDDELLADVGCVLDRFVAPGSTPTLGVPGVGP
jgi:hypothetical protein